MTSTLPTLQLPILDHPLNTTLQKLQTSFDWVKLYTKPEGESWYSYQDITKPDSGVFVALLLKNTKSNHPT
jgi:hypothetical protein